MTTPDFAALLDPALAGALEKRGFTSLTSVQTAVLDPALAGRDLRISSQTGSGKTVAIGFVLRDVLAGDAAARKGIARPRALVVTPTRELAKQVEEELRWLLAPLSARVASVIGGGDYRDERRAFAAGPAVVVGTPGRLLDHLNRGAVDPSQLGAVVLDEADRMLDLGFRDDLEKILAFAPEGHRTHLVSATFPREVKTLADRVQESPVHVEGSKLGEANADIEHVIYLVAPRQRIDAIVNLLLAQPDTPTLVFARTRADVAELARALEESGFRVSSLSGEMEQRERERALAAFKRGGLHALVATDVAARGIDVDIGRVIHAEPPTDADAYTHRSGRTGRAGRKGTSAVLVVPAGLAKTSGLLRRAGVRYRLEPLPTAASIRAVRDERVFEALTREEAGEAPPDARALALAERLVTEGQATRALARLIARAKIDGPTEPRDVTAIEPTPPRGPAHVRTHPQTAHERARAPHAPRAEGHRAEAERVPERAPPPLAPRAREATRGREPLAPPGGSWVSFRVSWGQADGADARRLLAMVCRRGGIRGSDVGSILVARRYSLVDIASTVAEDFKRATREADPRDPGVTIRLSNEKAHPPRAPHGHAGGGSRARHGK